MIDFSLSLQIELDGAYYGFYDVRRNCSRFERVIRRRCRVDSVKLPRYFDELGYLLFCLVVHRLGPEHRVGYTGWTGNSRKSERGRTIPHLQSPFGAEGAARTHSREPSVSICDESYKLCGSVLIRGHSLGGAQDDRQIPAVSAYRKPSVRA